MARYIEQGKSIFIPFHNGVSITDSQLHLRMYKTEEMFKRYFPPRTKYDVLCEYAPVVRCKDCKHWLHMGDGCGDCSNHRFHLDGHADPTMNADDFCSCGERRASEIQESQSL